MNQTVQDETTAAHLANLARDMRAILIELREVVKYMKDAESEVPEKMRRFMMYMHDVHETAIFIERGGQEIPNKLKAELRRCDDRYYHLLDDLNSDTGQFERVRQEMSQREGNRWDHSRLIANPGQKP